jgi:Uma2 family endonuclease
MSPIRAVTIEERVNVPDSALDHAGYRRWVTSDGYPERVRTTFVRGEVLVETTPESIDAHNQVKAAITIALGTFVRERDLGQVFPDGVLVTNEEAGVSSEPDLTFVSWDAFDSGRVQLVPRAAGADYIEILGTPDLVVEIVSDSSVRKDTRLLHEAYARAGIREYWLIDARGPDLSFQVLANSGQAFSVPGSGAGPRPSVVLGGTWSLTRQRNRVARFTYTLERID